MRDIKLAFLAFLLMLLSYAVTDFEYSVQPKVVYAYANEKVIQRIEVDEKPAFEIVDGIPIPEGYEFWKTIWAKVTAYDPSKVSCGASADGLTSTLRNAWKMDGCAVDPLLIPYGTLLWIPGAGFKKADDTGAAMKKSWQLKRIYHIDIRVPYPYQAKQWGIKWLKIYLFKKKS